MKRKKPDYSSPGPTTQARAGKRPLENANPNKRIKEEGKKRRKGEEEQTSGKDGDMAYTTFGGQKVDIQPLAPYDMQKLRCLWEEGSKIVDKDAFTLVAIGELF